MLRSPARTAFLLLFLAGCSSSLGTGEPDIPPEGVTAPVACSPSSDPRPMDRCPGAPTIAGDTAGATIDALDPIAVAAYGTSVRWAGIVRGSGILRTGIPSGAAFSGWVTAFCEGDDALWFDVTAGACAVRNLCDCRPAGTCGGAACEDANDRPFPPVDSGTAISVAFPQDGLESAYGLSYDVRAGQWIVTRQSDGARKVVDGTAGTLVE